MPELQRNYFHENFASSTKSAADSTCIRLAEPEIGNMRLTNTSCYRAGSIHRGILGAFRVRRRATARMRPDAPDPPDFHPPPAFMTFQSDFQEYLA